MSIFSSLFKFSNPRSQLQSFDLVDGIVTFSTETRYQPIVLEKIQSISYKPRNEKWQEVRIELKDEGALNYYFDSSPTLLTKAVEEVCQGLKPTQPICQFILSAKQGSLSGKD